MRKCVSIGLTGGIASGKSAVSDYFKKLGCEVIDADIIAREVVQPNSSGLKQLVKLFGKNILTLNNELDRLKLRKIVFNNPKKLSLLNSVLHPLIKGEISIKVKQVTDSFCIVVIPLLCESSRYKWLDRVLVVDVKPKTQLKRLLVRDEINESLANKMMQSQCSREQRLKIADDVINNEQSMDKLYNNVDILHRLYKSL